MADAFWVHGNAAQVQLPTDLVNIAVTGPGLTASAAASKFGWIHIPLPTPTVIDDVRAVITAFHLDAVFSNPNASIDQLVLYDGQTQVYSSTNSYGDGSLVLTVNLPTPHSVSSGIGLSIHFGFLWGVKGTTPPADDFVSITIRAAGADYTYQAPLEKAAIPGLAGESAAATKK
ncbi:MAG TPA: DUF6623 family protein [Galbitalea sp.]